MHTVPERIVRSHTRARMTSITITAGLLLVVKRIMCAVRAHERRVIALHEHADVIGDIVLGGLHRVVELGRLEGVVGFALDGGERACVRWCGN